MASMVIKHSSAAWQCSCCDRKGTVRRAGKKGAKAKEAKAWRDELRRGEA